MSPTRKEHLPCAAVAGAKPDTHPPITHRPPPRSTCHAQQQLGLNPTRPTDHPPATTKEHLPCAAAAGAKPDTTHQPPARATKEHPPCAAAAGAKPDTHRPVPLTDQRARGRPRAIAIAATTPTAPLVAMTKSGAKRPAAAPATIMATPWPRLMPPWAMPNA
jgi:hypothetical protein